MPFPFAEAASVEASYTVRPRGHSKREFSKASCAVETRVAACHSLRLSSARKTRRFLGFVPLSSAPNFLVSGPPANTEVP